MQIIIALLKISLLYLVIIVAYKLMGKKNISELSIMDFVLFLLISNIITLSIPIDNKSFLYMIILIAFLIVIQSILTYMSSKFPALKYLFNVKPSLIIVKGKLNFKEMLQKRYNLDDLLLQLREKSIKNIEDVQYAVLENNGKLSISGYYKNSDMPLPIVLDGQIQPLNLKALKKDTNWLTNIISKENILLNNIFYAFYKGEKLYIIKNE